MAADDDDGPGIDGDDPHAAPMTGGSDRLTPRLLCDFCRQTIEHIVWKKKGGDSGPRLCHSCFVVGLESDAERAEFEHEPVAEPTMICQISVSTAQGYATSFFPVTASHPVMVGRSVRDFENKFRADYGSDAEEKIGRYTYVEVLEARPVSNVSRTHCRLAYDRRREEFYVVDFGSANGTRVHDPDPPLPWSYDVEGGVIGSADLFKRHREAKRYKCWLAPGKVITPGAPEVSIRVHVISNVPGAVEVDVLPRLTGEAAVAALRSPQVITPHTAVGSRASGSGSGTYVAPIRGASTSAAFPRALPGVDGGDGTRLRAGLDSFGTYAGLDNSLTGAEMRVLELTVVQDAEAVFGDPNSPRCMNNSHLICHPTVTYSFCRHDPSWAESAVAMNDATASARHSSSDVAVYYLDDATTSISRSKPAFQICPGTQLGRTMIKVLTDNVVDIWNGDPARAYEPRDRGHIDALRSDCHIRINGKTVLVVRQAGDSPSLVDPPLVAFRWGDRLSLEWEPAVSKSPVQAYTVYVLKSRDGHKRLGKTVSGERTGCILTDLEPNQTYWLALEATNAERASSTSRLVEVATSDVPFGHVMARGDYISSGAWGRILEATYGDKVVAIKEDLRGGHEYLLRREIEILQGLNHPNVVAFFGYESTPYYALILDRYHDNLGSALSTHFPDAISEGETAFVARELAAGLAYIHQRNIYHADLKAENVLVNLALRDDKGADEEDDGTAPLRITRVALADFGCAQRLTPETQVLVKRGTRGLGMFGPEAVGSRPTLRSDVWSFGSVMCYVASGTTCIGYRDGHAETSLMLALYAGDCTVDELVWPPDASPGLERFLRRCLVVDVEARATAAELLDDAWLANPAENLLGRSPPVAFDDNLEVYTRSFDE